MGFHKRFVNKENILPNLGDIDSFLNSDALIFDDWSYKFYQDLNQEERKLRQQIKEDLKDFSGCPDKHPDYSKLLSLSETLISLINNPSWLDIHFTQDKLGRLNLEIDEMGVLDKVKEKAIQAIIDYYDK